jgi:HlyD family secretion protein
MNESQAPLAKAQNKQAAQQPVLLTPYYHVSPPPSSPQPAGYGLVYMASPADETDAQLALIRRWQDPGIYTPAQSGHYPGRGYRRRRRRQHLRQVLLPLLFLTLLGGGLFGGAWLYGAVRQETTDSPADTAAVTEDEIAVTAVDEVIARAIVKPVRYAQLGFSIGGRVKERLVEQGEVVTVGQALVRLDDTQQLVAIAQARAGLQQAEAQLAGLQAGARVEEIATAQAVVDEARARLQSLRDETTQTTEESAAQAVLAAAEAKLTQLQAGPTEGAIIGVRAELQQANAAVQNAQAAYDQVSWRNDVAMLPEALQLQQATIAKEAAQARYDQLFAQADQAQISAVYAEIETARAALARLRTPIKQSEIEAAEAQLRQAEARLALLNAGPPAATIAAAQATVTAVKATLMAAEAKLAETILLAPFAGTIAEMRGEVGEQLLPGAAIVQLGDLASWQIETEDLVELDVVRVRVGAPVRVTIDALPGVQLTGKVVHIKLIGENKIGDMTYTVSIQLDQATAELAWNMTATVYITGNE